MFEFHSVAELLPLMQEAFAAGGYFRLYPRGRSMLPLLREGRDSVLLRAPEKIKKYDIVLFRRECGDFILHRVLAIRAEGLLLCGDAQTATEYPVPPEAVMAVVCAVYRDGRRLDICDPRLCAYAFLRSATRPLRRISAGMAARVRRLFHQKTR